MCGRKHAGWPAGVRRLACQRGSDRADDSAAPEVGCRAPSSRGRCKHAFAAALMVVVVTAIGLVGPTFQAAAANPAGTVIATYRARIPELMAEQRIPGLAVAIVDRDRAL